MSDLSIPQEPQLRAVHVDYSPTRSGGLIYLEQFDADLSCQKANRPILLAFNSARKVAILFHPACKCWDCEACAQVNKRRWIARAVHGCSTLRLAGRETDFVTLTSHEKLNAAGSFAVWPKAWMKLQARWRRKIGNQPYFAVPERHANGRLHMHLICCGELKKRWWKDNARACGMGYQSDVQEIADLGIAGYVGKYLGKTLDEGWPRGTRRVRTSRDWPDLPELTDTQGWTFRQVPQKRELGAIDKNLYRMGYDVVYASAEGSWALIDSINASAEPIS